MKNLHVIRDSEKERDIFYDRVIFAGIIMLILVAVIVSRLIYLQVYNHLHYTTLSKENHIKIRPVAPPRGLVLSQDGVLLAENRPSFSLYLVPEKVGDLDKTIEELTALLGMPVSTRSDVEGRLEGSPKFAPVVIDADLSAEQLAIFSVNQHHFPGVGVDAGLSRYYPLGEDTAHVLGYVARISKKDKEIFEDKNYGATNHIGKTGVEKARENILHGQVGERTVEVNAEGRVLRVLERVPPVPGKNIVLTIDSRLQSIAAQSLRDLGGLKGAIVAIEPSSGAVLASVSYPSFNPNEFVNGISRELYKEWSSSKARPLFDRALQGQYPPGSTIKPMVGLTAILDGKNINRKISCPGWFSFPGDSHRYRCWEKDGHGAVDLKAAIVRSCDVYFYKMSDELGIQKVVNVLDGFGFGRKTGIDLPGEQKGLLPSPEWKRQNKNLPWYPGETLITGIGQGFLLATPIQLAHFTATIAMKGQVRAPYLVQHIENSDGSPEVSLQGPPIQAIFSDNQEYWQIIADSMVEVVHGSSGTARGSGYGAPVRFAGKTGTSQVFAIAQDEEFDEEKVPAHLKDHALFIAFAPTENPQIALAVVVENGSSGSSTAAPIARKMIDAFFEEGGGDG